MRRAMSRRTVVSAALLASTAWVVSVLFAFAVGGRLGFTLGSAQRSSWETVSHGISAYHTLNRLPPEAGAEVRRPLKRDLDYALINYLFLADRQPSLFDLFERHALPLDPCKRLPLLAAHRATHPSPSNDALALQLIDQAVQRISSQDVVGNPDPKCKARPAA